MARDGNVEEVRIFLGRIDIKQHLDRKSKGEFTFLHCALDANKVEAAALWLNAGASRSPVIMIK